VIAVALGAVAAYGVFLIYTATAFGWRGVGMRGRLTNEPRRRRRSASSWMAQAGLHDVPVREFVAVVIVVAILGGALAFVVFGSFGPVIAAAVLFGSIPLASYRSRRDQRRAVAAEAWPRLIEEIRILTSSAGRSIPQSLFEAGLAGPIELRPAFEDAHREWVLSTDFPRTIAVLKERLRDPTADAACETLLVAHEIGGTDLDRRLEALSEDRRQDAQGRKDARAKQAGVRFARSFTIVVPLGMALVGLSIGDGRAAYQSTTGQLVVLAALTLMAACWVWASRIMRLPLERRVFDT